MVVERVAPARINIKTPPCHSGDWDTVGMPDPYML